MERKFHLPGDNDFHKIKDEYGKEIITANTHHLDDFCHHPTLIGLIASIVVQFSGETIYLDKNGELHNIPITVNEYGNFVGSGTPFKFFAGIINWFFTVAKTIKNQQGHLLSDMAGSSGSVAGGSGIPGFFISTLKEIAALPCLRDTSFNENLRKAFQNGIGSNKGQIDLGYFNELFKGASSKLDLRTEKAVTNELRRQAIPCIINETLVRAFYFIRRFIQQMKDVQSFSEINWKELLPIRNRTITRMLTISKGVFLTVDAVDAWLKSKNDIGTFLLRINFIGTLSFSITVVADLKMRVKKCFKENTGIGVNVKLIDLYKQQAAGLTKILNYTESKGPLFLHIDEEKYKKTKKKLMFVGTQNRIQHTYREYRNQEKGLLNLFEEYKTFKFSKRDYFGTFAEKLVREVNKAEGAEKNEADFFLWNSIFKFSNHESKFVALENENFNVLVREIKICNPDAVIFMTGKKYDDLLRKKLGEIEFEEICNKNSNKNLRRLRAKTFAKINTDKVKSLKKIDIYRIPKQSFFSFINRRASFNWLLFLLTGKQKSSKKLFFILPLIILLFTGFFATLFLTYKKEPAGNVSYPTEIISVSEPIVLEEQKSTEFRADRRDFAYPVKAAAWLDEIADLIEEKIKKNPKLKFMINGYVAEFDNEIDDKQLATERAEKVKKELILRGIQEEILIINPVGRTSRWGKERKNNRAVTVESVER